MSLSRLERLQEQAEEERVSKLRAKQRLDSTDETKRRKKLQEEDLEQTRFAFKGTHAFANTLRQDERIRRTY